MPIIEHDPWREQYFDKVTCPDDVIVSTDDTDSYRLYPEHRWIYNKLLIAETQDLPCAPHGIAPQTFPVFSKPIYNLRGMGMETRVFHNLDEYLHGRDPGHMWVELLTGDHVSSDVAVLKGEPVWWRHVVGEPGPHGTFDYWTIQSEHRREVEEYCGHWIRQHFASYTGMMNLETIGGRIIEGHLRFSDQWPDLYGEGWLEAVVALHTKGEWSYADDDRKTGYSAVLFGAHDARFKHPPKEAISSLLDQPQISSVQITFHEDKHPSLHAMPPGGFRLAVINCWDLDAGIDARLRLIKHFWSSREVIPRRRTRRAVGLD